MTVGIHSLSIQYYKKEKKRNSILLIKNSMLPYSITTEIVGYLDNNNTVIKKLSYIDKLCTKHQKLLHMKRSPKFQSATWRFSDRVNITCRSPGVLYSPKWSKFFCFGRWGGGGGVEFWEQLFHKDITEWVGEWRRLPMLPTIDPSGINIKKWYKYCLSFHVMQSTTT